MFTNSQWELLQGNNSHWSVYKFLEWEYYVRFILN